MLLHTNNFSLYSKQESAYAGFCFASQNEESHGKNKLSTFMDRTRSVSHLPRRQDFE